LYYRSEKIGSRSLVLIAVAAVTTIAAVELFPATSRGPDSELMLSAARRTDAAYRTIHERRIEQGHRILADQDPAGSGMLGPSMSLVTSLPGHLNAKQTSANPNFAAVAVHYLLEAGARPGDKVAIGCTGSFPALNIAVLAAAETMGLEPTLISSAASSQFGANDPQLMWPEMECLLAEQGILTTRSEAISRGGFRDTAAGMTDQTRQMLEAAIARGGRPLLDCDGIEDSIHRRMQIFIERAGEISDYAAYINVGGGSASVGGTNGNDQLGHGLIYPATHRRIADPIDSVASRFLAANVPLINMVDVVKLAQCHGLPVAPIVRPEIGQGDVYTSPTIRRSLAILGIALILAMTAVVVRPPVRASQWLATVRGGRLVSEPRWMV
jgi:poly-gamma-glutamate system protein